MNNYLKSSALFAVLLSGCAFAIPPVRGPISGTMYRYDVFGRADYPEAYYQELREAYVRNHPNLSQRTKDAILNKKIFVGMPAEQVEVSWGRPFKKQGQILDAFGESEIWEYRGHWVWMANGKVSTIQDVSDYY